ncbi:MAG: MBL fold metallo-hydrolase [bacterium]
MLNLLSFVLNPFYENTYIVWDDFTKDAMIIDPGCLSDSEENELKEFIDSKRLNLKYLINTHCHIDHIFGNAFFKDNYNLKFLAPEGDVFLLDNATEKAGMFGVEIKPSPKPDGYLSEDQPIFLGESEVRFLFTPGHTPGEYCVYFPLENICICGDVLFKESIGRTDLWGGNFAQLLQSIRQKLFTLPDDTTVYSGHGEPTTIGHEKKNNPFLNA